MLTLVVSLIVVAVIWLLSPAFLLGCAAVAVLWLAWTQLAHWVPIVLVVLILTPVLVYIAAGREAERAAKRDTSPSPYRGGYDDDDEP